MIRTRFAPSPTGFMHLGNLRTALYAYLIAKSAEPKGTFILRIEDTDRERLIEGSLEFILKTLKSVGLNWDEGPEVGGDYGPYIQSERKAGYLKFAEKLIENKTAYYCICSDEECLCKGKQENEIKNAMENGYAIRQAMPKEGSTTFIDLVYGEIKVENKELEDQILIKRDGLPTYNFANVIDDHLMAVTHVVRGSEYLSSTPKYVLLYEALNIKQPEYIHLPLILNEEKEKLSKRRGDANFEDLIEEGFLAEAVLNYIALLGWAPKDNKELFSLKELEEAFYIEGIGKSPSSFDKAKLTWLNGEYIKNMLEDDFYNLVSQHLKSSIKKEVDLKKVASYCKSRVNFAHEVTDLVDFIDELKDYGTDLYLHKKMKTTIEGSILALEEVLQLDLDLEKTIEKLGVKNGQVLWPVRTALTGKPTSFCGAHELIELLGKEESIKRINIGLKMLKGLNL
ncbi:MAG: glutamate--tRNA ligase [Defluviitaleaceae bacterium]|nr:glutamate--tRNA ligase [Defluviitaleaceae bacterium]